MAEATKSTAIIWFRNDLRLTDNAALTAACKHDIVIPIFIYDDNNGRTLGAAKKYWLHHSLKKLDESIRELGNKLILRSGSESEIIKALVADTGASAIYWNRRYVPSSIEVDKGIKADLTDIGVTVKSFAGHILHEPTKLTTKAGTPFRVFTPFWRTLDANLEVDTPYPRPENIPNHEQTIASDQLDSWNLTPIHPDWSQGIAARFTPGENAAALMMSDYLEDGVQDYSDNRDFPSKEATSTISPYMTFGEISPRQIWHASQGIEGAQAFRRQLAWRDFSHHLLFHNPTLDCKNFNSKFDTFDWNEDHSLLQAWQKGQTGYPIVDAGMRELWQTGYMHNRVRMIVASFLTKHLLIDWRLGEQWFWDTLVDADQANNAASWQWVAGSGADASPYYRIFNPIIQGKKFDTEGQYVKQYLPELAKLDTKYIHTPWEAPAEILKSSSIILDVDYPKPIVEHSFARQRALDVYGRMKNAA